MNISDVWKEFLKNLGKKFKDKTIEIAQSSVTSKSKTDMVSANQYMMFDEKTQVDLFGDRRVLNKNGKLGDIIDSNSAKEPLSDFNNKLKTALNCNP